MPITINEMLLLPIFEEFRLVAGESGLKNSVKLVGIIDHESIEMIGKSFEKNEFVLSTFLNINVSSNDLFLYVQELIKKNISGLAIKDIYFKSIPQNVIDLANENSFPIFLFSTVFYEDIITNVFEANREKECLETLTLKIDSLINEQMPVSLVKQIGYEINRDFQDIHLVVFCKNKRIINTMKINYRKQIIINTHAVLPYKQGLLVFLTFKDIINKDIESIVKRGLNDLGINKNNYNIGVSKLADSLTKLHFSLNQCLYAYKYSIVCNNNYMQFDKLGVNQMLFPILKNEWVCDYYNSLLSPIIDFDQKNEGSLLQTAFSYVKNGGDIKATAKELYQHTNTVRYRLSKISDILNDSIYIQDFYTELSIAIKLYLLKNTVL